MAASCAVVEIATEKSPRRGFHVGQQYQAWLFLLPLVLVLLLVAYPFVDAVWLSLTNKRVGFVPTFIGLANFRELIKSEVFFTATANTLLFTFFSITMKLGIGMTMALALNQDFPFQNVVRGIMVLPWVIPTVVSVRIWYWMFNDMAGVINTVLMRLHISRPIPWLAYRWLALACITVVNIWRGFAFFGVNLLAGMQTIELDLYEAAKVDGANALQTFRHITLPGLRHVIMVVTMLSSIWTLNDFQIVHILTRGGPGTATMVYATLTYEIGIASLQLGRGIAVSLFLFPLILIAIATLVYLMQHD